MQANVDHHEAGGQLRRSCDGTRSPRTVAGLGQQDADPEWQAEASELDERAAGAKAGDGLERLIS